MSIKVNAFVDEGIAPLVAALSGIEGLVTLESCERGDDGLADVYFSYGAYVDWRELGAMLESLAGKLRELNICCGFSLTLEWFGSNDQPRARLSVKPEHAAEIADLIERSF